MNRPHERAEIIAGAIALGEATDDERIEYRRHLAGCARCLHTLGGEHELIRVGALIGVARESEVWEPDVRGGFISRLGAAPRRFVTYGVSFLAVCLLVSFLGHLIVGSQLTQMRPSLQDPLTISYEGNRIILERRSVRDQKPAFKPRPQVVVHHNVVRAMV
ncbi:MAG: zf-HC2 domain-containing protein, partial [Candidatus Eremiobacteraeota bacterium]|nr:zf-HC2 domain-containing protein [Candidatus Eremiobacteraeota bacterium]